MEMAAIGLGDLAGGDWGMGSWGRPNMSAKALGSFKVKKFWPITQPIN